MITKTAPFTATVHSRKRNVTELVPGYIEMRFSPRFIEYAIRIPDRRKKQWTRKVKFENYMVGVCILSHNPGSNAYWGREAASIMDRMYREWRAS